MQILFEDSDLEQLILKGRNNKYKKYAKDKQFMEALARDYNVMLSVESADKLAQFSFLHYEKLVGIGQSSVRVMNGRVERILFRETDKGVIITIIELNTTHYGRKK